VRLDDGTKAVDRYLPEPHPALSDLRRSATVWVVVAATGGASVGVMAAVDSALRSDFRWLVLGLALLWAAAAILSRLSV